MFPRISFASALLAVVLVACSAQSQQEPIKKQPSPGPKATLAWTPELTMQVKKIGGVQIAPDGKHVVYTVTSAVMDGDKSEFVAQIHLTDSNGKNTRQLTYADKSSDNPQWSPDGKWIAFTSTRSGKRNLWLLNASGGEAEQLTDVKTSVVSYKWAPDGAHLAFTKADAPSAVEEKNAKQKNDARVVDEHTKQVRLYLLPVAKNDKGQRPERLLTKGNYSVGFLLSQTAFDWAPDSKTIAFTHTPTPSPDNWVHADISLVDVDSGKVKAFAKTAAAEGMPLFSPDGKHIAFVASDNPPSWGFKLRVFVQPVAGGKAQALAVTEDERPNLVAWPTPGQEGDRIYFTETYKTSTRLLALTLPTEGKPSFVLEMSPLGGVLGDVHMTRTGAEFAYTQQWTNRPMEVFFATRKRVLDQGAKPISQVNAALAKVPTGFTGYPLWRSKDEQEIAGLLTYPVGYEKGKQYPLLLVIHGGPAGAYTETFIGNQSPYPVATFAAKGYMVLRCNPRGSSGYGSKFRYANYQDWGGGDYQDLMTGVDELIKDGSVNPKQMGVMGWSYGGFMTSWVVTQTHRFKAASIGAPVTDLVSFTGTADIPGFLPDYFGGEFWQHPERYRKHSPIAHVKGVKTPALIQHGEKDDRVPIGQGYEFYNALKRQGVLTQMVVYPRMPHGPTEPRHLLDIMQRNVAWMDRHVRGIKE